MNWQKNMHGKIDLSEIKLIIFDLQGTLISEDEITDLNKLDLRIHELNEFAKVCSVKGIKVIILSGINNNKVIKRIEEKSHVDLIHSSINKVDKANKIAAQYNLEFDSIMFIGNDLLDIPLLKLAGVGAAPKTARREVKRIVDYVLPDDILTFLTEKLNHS
ncbi:MAG: HAD hydrolase family protein [Melioribacteraceae bacterium]|nr:HAD hydrolase family protein [Melioribacteraceae bacterium]